MCADRPRGNVRKKGGSDLRTEFERDYHRIISSASFRRLQDKTQVFPLEQNDFIRTRLTHSLEVASFARSIGQNLGNKIISEKLDPDFTQQMKEDIGSVLECAGLLHDIGNPPFGHFGESAIQDWFKENLPKMEYNGVPLTEFLTEQMVQDFYHFEGNTQALRVVTKLHFMVDDNGMNLTKALLATIMKYPGSSLDIADKKTNKNIARKKMGYFYADRETFHMVQEACGTNGARHPLCFALEAADDIAYRTADIEDAIKKKCLSFHTLIGELRAACDAEKIEDFIADSMADCVKKNAVNITLKTETYEAETLKGKTQGNEGSKKISTFENLIDKLENYYARALEMEYESPELYAVQNWIVRVQGVMLTCATDSFVKHYDEIMAGTYEKELLADTEGEALMNALGDIAYRHAFISEPILKLEVAANAIFSYLLGGLTKALLYYDTDAWDAKSTAVDQKMVGLISSSFMRTYKIYSEGRPENEKLYLRFLLATDYVSGMTDSYAKRLYQELRGID